MAEDDPVSSFAYRAYVGDDGRELLLGNGLAALERGMLEIATAGKGAVVRCREGEGGFLEAWAVAIVSPEGGFWMRGGTMRCTEVVAVEAAVHRLYRDGVVQPRGPLDSDVVAERLRALLRFVP